MDVSMVRIITTSLRRLSTITSVFFSIFLLFPASAICGDDADGLDLTPRPGPEVWVAEYWDVAEGKMEEFLAYYQSEIYPVMRVISGYRGYSMLTLELPGTLLPRIEAYGGAVIPLGPPKELFPVHPGQLLKGETRTDRSVHLEALLRGRFNLIFIHHMQSWDGVSSFAQDFIDEWAKRHNGEYVWDALARDFFPMVNNHWDTFYHLKETSFVTVE